MLEVRLEKEEKWLEKERKTKTRMLVKTEVRKKGTVIARIA
eukprot:jgi/Antlo1/186/2012